MDIKDNTFSRQFETFLNDDLVAIEYSFQDRKIFLTKIQLPAEFSDEDFLNEFIVNILEIAIERKLKVVPVLPKIATFFRKNPSYKDLLPPGIKL